MATSKEKSSQPVLTYQVAPDTGELLDSAFDILFEETMEKYGLLTTKDN